MKAKRKPMFAIRAHGKYLRFGSYRTGAFVTYPEAGSLYSRRADADRKLAEDIYVAQVRIPRADLAVWEVEFGHTSRAVRRTALHKPEE